MIDLELLVKGLQENYNPIDQVPISKRFYCEMVLLKLTLDKKCKKRTFKKRVDHHQKMVSAYMNELGDDIDISSEKTIINNYKKWLRNNKNDKS